MTPDSKTNNPPLRRNRLKSSQDEGGVIPASYPVTYTVDSGLNMQLPRKIQANNKLGRKVLISKRNSGIHLPLAHDKMSMQQLYTEALNTKSSLTSPMRNTLGNLTTSANSGLRNSTKNKLSIELQSTYKATHQQQPVHQSGVFSASMKPPLSFKTIDSQAIQATQE